VEIAFELVCLAVAVLAGTALAERLRFPAPLGLIVVGVIASYVPGIPTVHLTSDVVLLGLLPPLLYSAAIGTSLVDFNANRRPILLLSVGLVVFTTVGVGVLVHALLPGIDWWAALAIGAVVAPPDAVAATAIGRRIGLPRRIVTILEGESLFNDATALVSLRTAIAAGAGGVELWHVGRDFLVASVGGLAIGAVAFLVVAHLRRHITDPILDTAISFVVPYATYTASEEVHSSGIVSVVVAGLLLGHKAPVLQTAQSRIAERMNWRTIAYFLENTVFLLIGLQAEWILEDVQNSGMSPGRVVAVCGLTLLVAIVLRMVWVFLARYLLIRPGPDPDTGKLPSPKYTILLGWAGMRGVVTLAAAFVIPPDAPYRDVLLLVAFKVVAGTLFLQGLTLPALARWLKVPAPDPLEDALARATVLQQASKAGF
jgi:CPA1 family monovalent cation:H+ antiporter